MGSIESFIEKTNAASSAEEVFNLFQEALHQLGFDRIVYSLVTDHPGMNKKAGHGIVRSYPEDWMKYYKENGYERTDPVPQHVIVTDRPFTWDWLVQTKDLDFTAQRVMDEAREAKLLDGVGIPIHGANGEIAGLGLASATGGINPDKNMLCVLRALSMQFHLAYSEQEANAENIEHITLTSREREILLWAAEGKSGPVIADILGISYATVRFHMSNIFRKLGTNERIFAVVKALRHGLILPNFVSPITSPYQTR